MSNTDKCKRLLREISKSATEEYTTYLCKIKSVDGYRCTVERVVSKIEIENVRLNTMIDEKKGLFVVPEANSYVMVTHIDASNAFVSQYSKVEKVLLGIGDTEIDISKDGITFNGGSETMAKATELEKQLDKMSGRIDSIILAILSASITPTDGGAAFKASLVTALKDKLTDKESFADIRDKNIKH